MTAKSLRVKRECESAGEGCADLDGAIQDVSQRVLREQEADRSLVDALQLQEQGVSRMEHQLQERDETIRALRQELDVRMRLVEGRMDILEEQFKHFRGREASEGGSRQESKEPLETTIVKMETSAGSALGGTVFPRVDALVAELEKRLPLRAPCASQPPPLAPPAASSSSSAPRPPPAGALGATASEAGAAGARQEPAPSRRRARTSKDERERQREELQVRQASAKVERALAALGLA